MLHDLLKTFGRYIYSAGHEIYFCATEGLLLYKIKIFYIFLIHLNTDRTSCYGPTHFNLLTSTPRTLK
jgi:hypothetical protein